MNEYEAAVIRAAREAAKGILETHPNIRDAQDIWFHGGTKGLVLAVDALDNFEKYGDPIDPDHLGAWGPANVGTQWGRAAVGFDYGSNEILHINELGSRTKLCGETGGLGTWPTNATCVDCRTAYAKTHQGGGH